MSDRRRVVGIIAMIFLAIAMLLSGLVITNYKHLGTLIKVVNLVNNEYIEPVNATQLVDGAIKGIVESLDDPYSVYMDPKMYKELKTSISGSFGGVGITVGIRNEHITVIAPLKGTPAYEAGIKAGDVIAKINDKEALDMDIDTAVGMMRGKIGTKVKLSVIRKGESKTLDFELTRKEITYPSVEGKLLKDERIAYIQLHQFNTNSPQELEKTLRELGTENFDGTILDLRGDPGGDLEACVDIAQYFIPKGKVVSIKYRSGETEEHYSRGPILKKTLVVLINGSSASASEILAGAVKDTSAGTLIGTKTFGKGVVQGIFELNNNAGLKLTTAKYYTPKGKDIHKKGINPDIEIPDPDIDLDDIGNPDKDTQYARALAEIRKMMK